MNKLYFKFGLAYVLTSFIVFNIAFWKAFFYPTHKIILDTNAVGEIMWEPIIVFAFTFPAIYALIIMIKGSK